MTGFIVGDKVVSPLIPDTEVELIKKEDTLLKPVTLDTMTPIELTDEQNAAIVDVKNAIDITSEDTILSYGVEESTKLSQITDKTLSQVSTRDMGDIGQVITDLTVQLSTDGIDNDAKGLARLFSRTKNKLKSLQIQYESAQKNIERTSAVLENHQLTLIRNNKDMNEMKEANRENFQRLSVYVDAGKMKIKELNENELVELTNKAQSGDQSDVNKLTEFKNQLDLFEKQIHDLDAVMSLSQAMAIQLETITNSNKGLIQKMNRSRNIMIPAWKNYMVIAFYGEQSQQALEADKLATDKTNELLKQVASKLRTTNAEIAQQNEKSVIDISTLESMTSDIILSLQDVENARIQGKANRDAATVRMGELRESLKQQLIATTNPNKP